MKKRACILCDRKEILVDEICFHCREILEAVKHRPEQEYPDERDDENGYS